MSAPTLPSRLRSALATLLHLARLLTTTAGIDSLLSTAIFTATLAHSQLTRLLAHQYNHLALALVSKTSTSTSTSTAGETAVATLQAPQTRLAHLTAATKALADTCAETWTFLRLFGLLHIYTRLRRLYSHPPHDPWIKTLVYAQVGCAAVFQGMENAAYLATKGVLRGGKRWEKRAAGWLAVSNRFWMGEVVLEGLRLLRVRQLRWDEGIGAEAEDEGAEAGVEGEEGVGVEGKGIVSTQSAELKRRWTRDFYANAGWFPMTLHWSYVDEADSPVTETWQGISGLVPSVILLQDAWRESA